MGYKQESGRGQGFSQWLQLSLSKREKGRRGKEQKGGTGEEGCRVFAPCGTKGINQGGMGGGNPAHGVYGYFSPLGAPPTHRLSLTAKSVLAVDLKNQK